MLSPYTMRATSQNSPHLVSLTLLQRGTDHIPPKLYTSVLNCRQDFIHRAMVDWEASGTIMWVEKEKEGTLILELTHGKKRIKSF